MEGSGYWCLTMPILSFFYLNGYGLTKYSSLHQQHKNIGTIEHNSHKIIGTFGKEIPSLTILAGEGDVCSLLDE